MYNNLFVGVVKMDGMLRNGVISKRNYCNFEKK